MFTKVESSEKFFNHLQPYSSIKSLSQQCNQLHVQSCSPLQGFSLVFTRSFQHRKFLKSYYLAFLQLHTSKDRRTHTWGLAQSSCQGRGSQKQLLLGRGENLDYFRTRVSKSTPVTLGEAVKLLEQQYQTDLV